MTKQILENKKLMLGWGLDLCLIKQHTIKKKGTIYNPRNQDIKRNSHVKKILNPRGFYTPFGVGVP